MRYPAIMASTMATIDTLPRADDDNGWNRILPPRRPRPPLERDIAADWLVVGAGYAGLAAARRLAENRPGDRIVLLDALEAGEGASGRNSGFAIDLPHNVRSSFDELEGPQRIVRLNRAAIDHLEDVVRRGAIQCQWSRRGKYHAAASPAGKAKILEPFAEELEALGEPYRWLDGAALAEEIGTPYYHAAVHTPGGVLMNPAALVRGLADTLPEGVELYERTPVTALDHGGGVRATTPHGTVAAPAMILAANGFAESFGFFRGRLLPFVLYGSLTRPLEDREREALGGDDDWGLTPANAIAGVTLRLTQDRRILIRQVFDYAPGQDRPDGDRAAVRRNHEGFFRGRFPMLPEVTFDHTWAGYVCLSGNEAPGFGRVAPNVLAAVCQNAVGVTKGTIGGLLAADLATGRDNPLIADMESLGAPNRLPPRPFLDLGVRARLAWERWSGRGER